MILSALVTVMLAGAPAAKKPYTVQDQVMLKRASSPRVSPDGTKVVFALRSTDLEANKGRTDLWLVGTDGKGLRQLTSDAGNEVEPTWAPDGTAIYFLSARSGSNQLWKLRLDGGESQIGRAHV